MLSVIAFYGAVSFFYLADALQKTTSSTTSTWPYILVRSFFTTITSFAITICWQGLESFPTSIVTIKIMRDSVICAFGLFFFLRSLKELNFSNVGSLSIIGVVIQQGYYFLFQQRPLTVIDLVASILMSLGLILQGRDRNFSKGALFVLASTIFWTVGYISLSETLQVTNFYWSVPIMELTILLTSLLAVPFSDGIKLVSLPKNISWYSLLGIAVLIYISSLLNNYSYKHNSIQTISILQLSMMPITYVTSLRLFREKPTWKELISFLAAIIGFTIYIAF